MRCDQVLSASIPSRSAGCFCLVHCWCHLKLEPKFHAPLQNIFDFFMRSFGGINQGLSIERIAD